MEFFPLFADLNRRAVLVVGAGVVAARKTAALLQAGAHVRVVARELGEEMASWCEQGRVQWLAREFVPVQLDDAFLTIAATDDAALNQAVFAAGEARSRLVNVVDAAALCSFICPARIERGPVQIAISTGGAAPVLARQLRSWINARLPAHVGPAAVAARRTRARINAQLSEGARRSFWEAAFDNPDFAHASQSGQGETFLMAELERFLSGRRASQAMGSLTTIEALPSAQALTLAELRHIERADCIVFEPGVAEDILALARRDAHTVAASADPLRQVLAQRLRGQHVVWLRQRAATASQPRAAAANHWPRLRTLACVSGHCGA